MPDTLAAALAYLHKMPTAQSGSGGHKATLQAALVCRRFGLSDSDAWEAMSWYNHNRCSPEWSEKELRHKLESVAEVPIKKPLGGRVGEFKSREPKKFTPKPAPQPVHDPRPIYQQGEQAEELWWAKWCVDHGTTLEEFDKSVGNS